MPTRRLLCATLLGAAGWAHASAPCEIPGDPVHWIADYCMASLQTDDEIAAADCIARELRRARGDACSVKRRYKQSLCRLLIAREGSGTLADCLRDPEVRGSTERGGGVGGPR